MQESKTPSTTSTPKDLQSLKAEFKAWMQGVQDLVDEAKAAKAAQSAQPPVADQTAGRVDLVFFNKKK